MGVEETRVSTLELFFDLVFVFTITQLTTVLIAHPNLKGLAAACIKLALIWWMYAGYSWLTNQIDVGDPTHRAFLLVGMAGWLVLALAIPTAFDTTGFTFGLAYLVIVVVHAGLFTHAQSDVSARSFLLVGRLNLLFATAVVVTGAIGDSVQWVVWSVAAIGIWVVPALSATGIFELEPAHFVERHGLVIIVALGESVVAIGIGAGGLPVDLSLIGVAILGLALVAGLWWTYFSDEQDVEHAMREADHRERRRMALEGFSYAHYALLLGIVLIAAALKKATGHPFDPASTAAAIGLGGGVALFLAGDIAFRSALRIAASHAHLYAALLAAATIPLGKVAAAAQIGALVVILAALGLSRSPLRPAAPAPRPASPPAPPR
jgi:low temperature requirement protein LtrA